MKTKRRLKKWVKVALAVILIGGFGLIITKICDKKTPDVKVNYFKYRFDWLVFQITTITLPIFYVLDLHVLPPFSSRCASRSNISNLSYLHLCCTK